ncbi:hypothetical protein B0H12DRAFT_1072499 [Mycena haematopus]|nr:hypothetical protein B0H12DRAFT_1072499 [Mycena haematopus]
MRCADVNTATPSVDLLVIYRPIQTQIEGTTMDAYPCNGRNGRVSTARGTCDPCRNRAVVELRKSPTERARQPCHGCRGTVATVTGGSPTAALFWKGLIRWSATSATEIIWSITLVSASTTNFSSQAGSSVERPCHWRQRGLARVVFNLLESERAEMDVVRARADIVEPVEHPNDSLAVVRSCMSQVSAKQWKCGFTGHAGTEMADGRLVAGQPQLTVPVNPRVAMGSVSRESSEGPRHLTSTSERTARRTGAADEGNGRDDGEERLVEEHGAS